MVKDSVKILLNTTLENKSDPLFSSIKPTPKLNLQNPDSYFSQYEFCDRLIMLQEKNDYRTNNNFINAFVDAYNLHKTLSLRPDDIKLQILNIISTCVNNNPEYFHDYFVNHPGKQELLVYSNKFDAEYFTQCFADLLKTNLKDKEFAEHYSSTFSTTNTIISTVNNISLMNTLKDYFSFTMILECGIPCVILQGTDDDWIKLQALYDFFKTIFAETELKNWFGHFDKIMNLFSKMRKNDPVDDDFIKEMWKRVISYVPQGSGGDKILGGWVRLFVPYTGTNKIIQGLDSNIDCLDYEKSYIPNQISRKNYYIASGWTNMISSMVTTPATLVDDNNIEYKIEFYSGFFPPHISESDEICMNIGYVIRENQAIKKDKLKKYYLEQGVKDGLSLIVPKRLQKHVYEILDAFDKKYFTFIGQDPEEEARKQYFMDNGLKIIKQLKLNILNLNKLQVPSRFEADIKEIKNLFNLNWVEFI